MFTMDDIVSGIEMEEEIEVFRERFFRSCSYENHSQNIVREDDGFLFLGDGSR